MKLRMGKRFWVLGIMTALVSGLASTSDAGLVPWVWDALFGPVRRPAYAACYPPRRCARMFGFAPVVSPCGPAGCPTTSDYPDPYASYAMVSSPCGPGGCPTSACGVTYSASPERTTAPPQPPADQWSPRTFEEAPAEKTVPPPNDAGFENPTRGSDALNVPQTGTTEALKTPEITIPKKAAPTPGAIDTPAFDSDGQSKQPETKEPSTRLPIPTLLREDKIAWRVVPERTRLPIRANYTSPTVARTRVELNDGWIPVVGETKLAGK